MTGPNANIDNVDTAYLQYVNGTPLGDAAAKLSKFGPCIDVWPTGYKTMGFGEAGTERMAADAISASIIGGLAISAEAGDSSAAGTLAAHRLHAGATLASAVMKSAFDSLRESDGRIMTLAIATNLTDPASRPSLAQTLLGQERLLGMFGGSVNDASPSQSSNINALVLTSPEDVKSYAANALTSYLARHFGGLLKGTPYMLAHAYAALVERSGTLNRPDSPGARVWLGALVEYCNAYSTSLPRGTASLQKMLKPQCYQIYAAATNRGVTSRGRGSNFDRATMTLSLPERRRSRADAERLGFRPGYEQQAAGKKGDLAVDGSKVETLDTDSPLYEWRRLISQRIASFMDCQEILQEDRGRVLAALGGLFNEFPNLTAGTIRRTAASMKEYVGLTRDPTGNEALDRFMGLVGARRDQIWPHWITAALAASSMARHTSDAGSAMYDKLMAAHAYDTTVQAVADHLINSLDLLVYPRVGALPPSALGRHGLKPGEAEKYFKLAGLGGPPVHIMQLAADVISFNGEFVIPCPRPQERVHLRGPSVADKWAERSPQKNPSVNKYAKVTMLERRRLRTRDRPGITTADDGKSRRGGDCRASSFSQALSSRYSPRMES